MNGQDRTAMKSQFLAMAKQPEGFAKRDLAADESKSTRCRVIDGMAKGGHLFTAIIHKNWVRYFDTAQRAAAYMDVHSAAYHAHKAKKSHQTKTKLSAGDVIVPAHVKVQRLPGVERWMDRKAEPVAGGFAALGPGKYLEDQQPARWGAP